MARVELPKVVTVEHFGGAHALAPRCEAAVAVSGAQLDDALRAHALAYRHVGDVPALASRARRGSASRPPSSRACRA